MRRCSLLTLSILLLALWLSDASHRDSSSIPRSNQRTPISTEHRRYPPWNASPNIDDDGFLVMQYSRLPGEWESEFRIRKRHKKEVRTPANIRQVPGDGNCLFHSISTSYAHATNGTHIDLQDSENLQWLYQNSASLREKAVDCLEQKRKLLFLQGHEYLRSKDLVEAAASQYGISGTEYCQLMRQDSYWGGGPEIVALCNVLQRPIHVYELYVKNKQFVLRRMACFGSPKFDRNRALHILSADSRFPDLAPGKQLASGNHFLAMFPVEKQKKQRLRGGDADTPVESDESDRSKKEPSLFKRLRWVSKMLYYSKEN